MPITKHKDKILALLKEGELTAKEIAIQINCPIDTVKYHTRKATKNKSATLAAKLKKLKMTEEFFKQYYPKDKKTGQYLCKISGKPIDLNKDKWSLRNDKELKMPYIYLMRYSILLSFSNKELIEVCIKNLESNGYEVKKIVLATAF